MKTLKSRKAKILLCTIAIVLIVSVLATTLLACKKTVVNETPDEVFFVGDLQKNLSAEEISAITAEGETVVSVNEMLQATGWKMDNAADVKNIVAGIYALAVTNYGNLTQTTYLLMTDASVSVKGSMIGDLNVGVKSTYSDWIGKNGKFSQTISGVSKLDGIGSVGNQLKNNFGYNIQSFTNDEIYAFRRGDNGGANFLGKNDADVYKYIMGAKQDFPTRYNNKGTAKTNSFFIQEQSNDEETEEPSEPLPERENAWSPLNRIQSGELEVAGTTYYTGVYGAGFANYDFSRAEYLADDTSITYDAENDIYRLNIVVKEEYVDKACDFAKGALVRDTKAYIELKDAYYTECTNVIEVYGSGLIKSIQKIETLVSDQECKIMSPFGSCKEGGSTSNRAIAAFSYSDEDTDALRLAALYFPELGDSSYYTKAGVSTDYVLDLSDYPSFGEYTPAVNEALVSKFENILKD